MKDSKQNVTKTQFPLLSVLFQSFGTSTLQNSPEKTRDKNHNCLGPPVCTQ